MGGIGHKQQTLFNTNWKHQHSHGGILRRRRRGRGTRPLSSKEPLHAVFKVDRRRLRQRSLRTTMGLKLIHEIIRRYSLKFYVKVEQLSIQGDHLHILIRAPRRSQYHFFFRVVAGQIAQVFEREGLLQRNGTGTPQTGTGLWLLRPFSRVVKGYRAYRIVRDYIQLNEKEALGEIPYQKRRLRGLSSSDWQILWR